MLYNAEIQLSTNFLDKYCKGYTQKEAEKIITHDHIVLYSFALGWWCKDVWSFKIWRSWIHICLMNNPVFILQGQKLTTRCNSKNLMRIYIFLNIYFHEIFCKLWYAKNMSIIYRNTNCNFKVNISIDLIASFLFSILKYKQNLANQSKLNGLWLL